MNAKKRNSFDLVHMQISVYRDTVWRYRTVFLDFRIALASSMKEQ